MPEANKPRALSRSSSHAPRNSPLSGSSRVRAPLSVAIARAYRSMESRLQSSPRRRCTAGSHCANSQFPTERSRQRRILEALVDARIALHEALRVDFGDRYALRFTVSDLDGWPKLELHLIDTQEEFIPGFSGTVTDSLSAAAFEQSSRGLVFLALNDNEVLAHITVDDDQEFESLPDIITESVSRFLERASDASQLQRPDSDAQCSKPQEVSSAEQDGLDESLLQLNFSTDSYS